MLYIQWNTIMQLNIVMHQVNGNNHKYQSLDGHVKERNNSWSYTLGTQIPFIEGFGGSNLNFHIWH